MLCSPASVRKRRIACRAGLVETVMNVVGEIGADGGGRHGDARRPLGDEVFDVLEAVIARAGEIVDELPGGVAGQGLRTCGPHSRDPGQAGVAVPELGEVVPGAGADGCVNLRAALEREQGGVADEQGGVGLGEHGFGVRGRFDKAGRHAEKVAEQYLGVGGGSCARRRPRRRCAPARGLAEP